MPLCVSQARAIFENVFLGSITSYVSLLPSVPDVSFVSYSFVCFDFGQRLTEVEEPNIGAEKDQTNILVFGSVSRFGEILKICGKLFQVYLVLGKVFSSLWHNLYVFGQLFIAANGQILKTQSGHLVTLDFSAKAIGDIPREIYFVNVALIFEQVSAGIYEN